MSRVEARSTCALLVGVLLLSLVAVAATPGIGWAMVILVRVQTAQGTILIEGESTVPGHEGEIDVLGVSFGVSNLGGTNTGGGAGAGKLSFSDLSITKRVDKASPKLFLAVATGKHFPQVLIQFFDPTNKKGQLLLRFSVELADVLVSSFQFGGNSEGLTESLSLNFTKITLKDIASGETATAGKTGGI